jgi:hypothetical protein
MMTHEHRAAQKALMYWLQSQEIAPLDAAYIMAATIGEIVGLMSLKDRGSRYEALNILQVEMFRNADVLNK